MRDGKIKLEGWKSNWKVWNQTGRWQVKSDCCCGIRNTTNNQCPTWKTHILCVVQLQIGRWFNQGCFNAPLLLQQWEELSVIQHTHTHTCTEIHREGGGVIQTRTENGSIPRTANLDGTLSQKHELHKSKFCWRWGWAIPQKQEPGHPERQFPVFRNSNCSMCMAQIPSWHRKADKDRLCVLR